MAGSLIKVDEFTISSPVASVILGGGSSGSSGLNASIDSTYDVYMVEMSNVEIATASKYIAMRVTESGTANTTTNYDAAYKNLRADTTFNNSNYQNLSYFYTINNVMGNTANQTLNGIKYIFNANNSSEYTFFTNEISAYSNPATLWGNTGGEVFTSTSSVDGVQFFLYDTGNIDNGTFTLYGLKK